MSNATQNTEAVAVVGSPSTNNEITLDLLGNATREPLVGSMLMLTQPSGEGTELALGMVTEVTTVNQWHTNPAMRGVVKTKGSIPGMSGDAGDVRSATIKLQAAYRNSEPDSTGTWRQSGPSLRMSPPTGTYIRKVTDAALAELTANEADIHHIGTLHGDNNVRVPMQVRDFSGERGAYHTGIFGVSGSGKTAFAGYYLASQMRHVNHGIVVIDPQGQWSHEHGLPFSLQGFAAEIGREVLVRRISEDLRLEKDAGLFGELLSKTRFIKEIMKMATETQELLVEELVKVLKKINGWENLTSDVLMDRILTDLRRPTVLRRIYSDTTKRVRLMVALSELLGEDCVETVEGDPIDDITHFRDYYRDEDESRRADALLQFAPLHNLFSPKNPAGGARHSLWGTLAKVFDKEARGAAPAPLLILDLSTSGEVSWINDVLGDEDARREMEALKIIDQDDIKAAILRQTARTLKMAAEAAYRDGDTLNTQVVFDEAWRYAPPPHNATDPEIKALSIDLAGYARDTRKFGIGWTYITQTTRSLNSDIWDQITVRVLGYGLAGADIEKVGEQVDDRDHLKLYKGFAPPDSTNPKVYPFMITGPVSPLSFSRAPILLAAYTNFQSYRDDNRKWLEPLMYAQGKPVATGIPVKPGKATKPFTPRPVGGGILGSSAPKGKRATADIDRLREHRETGGVDMSNAVGLGDASFGGGGLDFIDEGQPAF